MIPSQYTNYANEWNKHGVSFWLESSQCHLFFLCYILSILGIQEIIVNKISQNIVNFKILLLFIK